MNVSYKRYEIPTQPICTECVYAWCGVMLTGLFMALAIAHFAPDVWSFFKMLVAVS